ncbi:TetR/AcrR family transcriptional regulator [Desulfovibrio ferrophilus]|uniref:Transcriptional regulator, TetR family n=1 Tax=Desulfovibrio ferrophilus TaxID=241368 RepID=A0A2Z6AXQ4_9BACT|nr:TetR/AcrR family transcriptional regulator [Desulfovibrio ferrophilus]BBD07985.1 transcriptional regulator, TetR family [Desulfovibrio ferrophilus]
MSKTKQTGKTKTPPRHNAPDLLTAGLDMLAGISIEQLTIDALCRHLGVTKGSFYHHFKGRRDYQERLLKHWTEQWTERRMRDADNTKNIQQRFLEMVTMAEAVPQGPEISIRAWAQRDPLAREHLEYVDTVRMEYLRSLFEELTGDADRAQHLSQLGYCLYVGTRMVAPPITGLEHAKLFHLMATEVYGLDLPEPE